MFSKLHDVCDVKTFESLCFAKVLLYQKGLCEKTSHYKYLLSPGLLPLHFCVNLKRISHNMKSEKKKKSHLAVYILIKGRKTHKILFAPLKKTSQTLNAGRYSEL